MRIMPFMKRKKGIQFAGVGIDSGGGGGLSLPIASSTSLGGVKVGAGLDVQSDGLLSANGLSFQLDTDIPIGKFGDDILYARMMLFNSGSSATYNYPYAGVKRVVFAFASFRKDSGSAVGTVSQAIQNARYYSDAFHFEISSVAHPLYIIAIFTKE